MTSQWKAVETPCDATVLGSLAAGDRVLLSGTLYAARDRAHERIRDMVARGEDIPVDLAGQFIYYMGPSPAPPGRVIGSAGPTTSTRMDPFTEVMLGLGVRGMIGKGRRGKETRDLMRQAGAVYFATYGGAGAYLAKRILDSRVAAFADLGPEALWRLIVRDFPLIVVNDVRGGDYYEDVLRKRR